MWKYLPLVATLATIGTISGGAIAYTPYQAPTSGYAAVGYGGYSASTGGYGTCGALKITEVLDQIYCHHGYYTRFTSTDLAAIKVVLYQLGLVTKFAHIHAVLEYVEQAIYILKDLKEETCKSYDTSELSKFYQGTGNDYSDLKGFLANETTALQGFEDIRRGYRKQFGMITWGTFTPDPFASEYTSSHSKRAALQPSFYPTASSVRRTRGSDSEYDYAGDYTCTYITSSYCAANSLVVKNVLYRVLKAVKSLDDALTVLYDYIKNHDCGTNDDNKYALLVTADTFGSTLTAASVLLQAAEYEYDIYIGMAGASSYSPNVYGRASGGSGSGYSSVYQGFPYGYVVPNPYRYHRAITTPAKSDIWVVG